MRTLAAATAACAVAALSALTASGSADRTPPSGIAHAGRRNTWGRGRRGGAVSVVLRPAAVSRC